MKYFFLLLLFLAAPTAQALSYTLEISQAELQEKVAAMMPLEKKKYFMTVIFSHPKIELAENANQIGIYSHIEISAPGGIKSSGSAKMTGALSYQPTTHEFFFKNPTIIEIKISKVPDLYTVPIKEIAQLIATKMLSSTPVYTLKGSDFQYDLAKSLLKSVMVKNKQLLVELALF